MYDKYGYRKDLMDRFGDDLTEEVLQYLKFEDKVRLECVSKQWRRLVYNKQFGIEFSSYTSKNNLRRLVRYIGPSENILKRQSLELLLNKCPNITKVNIHLQYIKNNELSLFGQYCPRLKSLYFENKSEEDMQFVRQYGHKLEELYLFGNYEIKEFLRLCPNVKNVWFQESALLFILKKELPKFEYYGKNFKISFANTNEMKILSDKYSKTFTLLNAKFYRNSFNDLEIYFDYISRFENLRVLRLELQQKRQPIDCLSLIGQKCTKLMELELNVRKYSPISHRFFNSFSKFTSIKKLKFVSLYGKVLKGSIRSLKNCKKLNHLDFGYLQISEDFFTNINVFLPKLQFISFSSKQEYSDSFIDSFHSMKYIQKVIISVYNLPIIEYYTKYWYFGKCLSEMMLSPNRKHIIRLNDDCGLITRYKGAKFSEEGL